MFLNGFIKIQIWNFLFRLDILSILWSQNAHLNSKFWKLAEVISSIPRKICKRRYPLKIGDFHTHCLCKVWNTLKKKQPSTSIFHCFSVILLSELPKRLHKLLNKREFFQVTIVQCLKCLFYLRNIQLKECFPRMVNDKKFWCPSIVYIFHTHPFYGILILSHFSYCQKGSHRVFYQS